MDRNKKANIKHNYSPSSTPKKITHDYTLRSTPKRIESTANQQNPVQNRNGQNKNNIKGIIKKNYSKPSKTKKIIKKTVPAITKVTSAGPSSSTAAVEEIKTNVSVNDSVHINVDEQLNTELPNEEKNIESCSSKESGGSTLEKEQNDSSKEPVIDKKRFSHLTPTNSDRLPFIIRHSRVSNDNFSEMLVYKLGSCSTPRKIRKDKHNCIKTNNWGTPKTNNFPARYAGNIIAKKTTDKHTVTMGAIASIPAALVKPVKIIKSEKLLTTCKSEKISKTGPNQNQNNYTPNVRSGKLFSEVKQVFAVQALIKKFEQISSEGRSSGQNTDKIQNKKYTPSFKKKENNQLTVNSNSSKDLNKITTKDNFPIQNNNKRKISFSKESPMKNCADSQEFTEKNDNSDTNEAKFKRMKPMENIRTVEDDNEHEACVISIEKNKGNEIAIFRDEVIENDNKNKELQSDENHSLENHEGNKIELEKNINKEFKIDETTSNDQDSIDETTNKDTNIESDSFYLTKNKLTSTGNKSFESPFVNTNEKTETEISVLENTEDVIKYYDSKNDSFVALDNSSGIFMDSGIVHNSTGIEEETNNKTEKNNDPKNYFIKVYPDDDTFAEYDTSGSSSYNFPWLSSSK